MSRTPHKTTDCGNNFGRNGIYANGTGLHKWSKAIPSNTLHFLPLAVAHYQQYENGYFGIVFISGA
jgi:hypothetical protein